LKDIVPRYWTMKGYRVERRFGWDCHGLPIEYEIDKTLGISGRRGVEEFGIAKYNAECRAIVQRFAAEWEKTIARLGRWVDFKNDYKTMDASFMESVWWVFGELWEKGLIYKSYRVMPYSTAVATPLSNFEAGSNYKDAQDPAITVKFQVLGQPDKFFLAWTTTPWTLPSNLALAMGKDISYVEVFSKKSNEFYVLAKSRLGFYFPKEDEYEIKKEFTGSEFVNTPEFGELKYAYEPLFPYFKDRAPKAFRVVLGDHVTDTDGTGIVHTAPAFGEDDFQVSVLREIITLKGEGIAMPVDDDGKFTAEVPDYQGRHVKDCDKDIIARLKNQGALFRHDTITHAVPFCWRSDTPLIYRAVSSWFVNVGKIKERMIEANARTHWVPETLRDGRFGNWLADARDWNISRNRFWGNPIPLWHNAETGDYHCIKSIAELEKLSGKNATDLHREFLDDLEVRIPGKPGVYKRVPEVLDCWFESGAMPYAQNHYPFENKETFEKSFPADFIAEGLDQTRGWFYTLTVLGAALFGKSPFKNVIVNGIITAEDGKKMSKRLKNYPDPTHVLDTYGADALRLYLINSPVVRADELRFSEAGVKDVVRRVLLKWWNSYSFFASYAVIDQWRPESTSAPVSDNILDRWIVSRLQSLLKKTETEMAEYHLYNVVPALLDFVEDLTNTYIRLNRKRFWGEEPSADKNAAYATLHHVLFTLTKVMAPFTPFIAETMYANLKSGLPGVKESVHLEDFPTANESLIARELEESVVLMNRVILMGRGLREKDGVKVKIPLKTLSVIRRDETVLKEVRILENYLKEELNVRAVEYLVNEDDFVELTAKANGAALGKKLGPKFGAVNKAVSALKSGEIARLESGGTIEAAGETIAREDVLIYRKPKDGKAHLATDAFVTVALDMTLGKDQIEEGLAREAVNRIQALRKDAGLKLSDRIRVEYRCEGELALALKNNAAYVAGETLAVEFKPNNAPQGQAESTSEIDGMTLLIALCKI
jgi:isoleucyl-tRNA synthetase